MMLIAPYPILLWFLLLVVIVVVVIGVALNVRRRDERHADRRGRNGAWGGAHRAHEQDRDDQPPIRVFQLIFAILLAPIFLFFWAIASIGDIVEAAVHLLLASLAMVFAILEALMGKTSGRNWRTAGRELSGFGRSIYSAGRRLVEYFGVGGLVDRVEDGIRQARGGGAPRRAPPPLETPPDAFPFEDRYRIESHLAGGGSTARLFVVRRLERDRPVGDRLVLKYFDMGLGSRLEEVLRESRGMDVAREMGIVLDHSRGPDHFYYVMPYYEGETLTRAVARVHRRLLSDQGLDPDDLDTVLDWMGQTLRILDAYHRRGVIHKDVKPDNLIVTEEGVRLVDLGLMTQVESALTLTTHGTEYFRDPEMVRLAVQGKRVRDVDAIRFDIYSSGAVLYLLLEGSFPACGPLSSFSRPVPAALRYVTSRAMAEGAKRYPSIAAMRADLERFREATRDGEQGEIPVSTLPSFRGIADGTVDADEPVAPDSPPPPLPRRMAPPPRVEPVAAEESRDFEPRRRTGLRWATVLLGSLIALVGVFFVLRPQGDEPAVPYASGPVPVSPLEMRITHQDASIVIDFVGRHLGDSSRYVLVSHPAQAPSRLAGLVRQNSLAGNRAKWVEDRETWKKVRTLFGDEGIPDSTDVTRILREGGGLDALLWIEGPADGIRLFLFPVDAEAPIIRDLGKLRRGEG